MSTYLKKPFLIDNDITVIVEAGARDLNDSIQLAKHYTKANVYAYECNPLTIDTCKENLSKSNVQNICFNPYALGETEGELEFFPYVLGNSGASSFLKRLDYENGQISLPEKIKVCTLKNEMERYNIDHIDLLAMDVQGFELNILKGLGDKIQRVRYVIIEEPKPIINTKYLPPDTHSYYTGAPSSQEISQWMKDHSFVEVHREQENMIEDNVMYKNTLYS